MIRTFVDLHVLQTVPPSNLNRDDTGSPKTATYGGVKRARVSSQAWKKATRDAFRGDELTKGLLDVSELAVRTRRVVQLVAEKILILDPEIEKDVAEKAALDVLEAAFTNPKNKKVFVKNKRRSKDAPEESEYLQFVSNRQATELAGLAVQALTDGNAPDKKTARAIYQSNNSIDLALFGRMVADVNDLNVDASCQVAHALSTHAVETEFDYFTAVDDQKAANADEDAGAGMIGTVEFNSATLYRFATIDVDQLYRNLGDVKATARAVHAFIEAFVRSMPTGKQNTFANRTLPDAVVITVRNDQPVSFVGAFENPVRHSESSGYIAGSAERLAEYAKQIADVYGKDEVAASWVIAIGGATKPLESLGAEVPLDTAIDEASDLVADRLAERSPADV